MSQAFPRRTFTVVGEIHHETTPGLILLGGSGIRLPRRTSSTPRIHAISGFSVEPGWTKNLVPSAARATGPSCEPRDIATVACNAVGVGTRRTSKRVPSTVKITAGNRVHHRLITSESVVASSTLTEGWSHLSGSTDAGCQLAIPSQI